MREGKLGPKEMSSWEGVAGGRRTFPQSERVATASSTNGLESSHRLDVTELDQGTCSHLEFCVVQVVSATAAIGTACPQGNSPGDAGGRGLSGMSCQIHIHLLLVRKTYRVRVIWERLMGDTFQPVGFPLRLQLSW